MILLVACILLNVLTVSLFKFFERLRVDTMAAIVVNYFVCWIAGNSLQEHPGWLYAVWNEPWFMYAFILSLLFITVFVAIARTAQEISLSVSVLAAKLSVVIPVSWAILFYNDALTLPKISGIVLSLIAVFAIGYKKESVQQKTITWLLPVFVFIGSGCIDTLLKYTESIFIPAHTASEIITAVFGMAACWGLIYLGVTKNKRKLPGTKELLAGIALGLPNYFSMYLLLLTLVQFQESSRIFPVINIGIAGLSALVSILLFKEKPTRLNIAGFVIALLSLILIAF